MRTVNIIFTLFFRGELGAPVSVADSGILLPRQGQLLRELHAELGPRSVGGRSWPPGAASRASRHGGCPERAGLPPVGGQGLSGVSFTVCICTSGRVVGWPPALAEEGTFDRFTSCACVTYGPRLCELVCDNLRVALVPCVRRTSRESFACGSTRTNRP